MSTIKVSAEIKREIERYRQFMLENEYTPQSTIGYVTHLSRFLRWADKNPSPALRVSITEFLSSQCESTSPKSFKGCRAALRLYYRMLKNEKLPIRPHKECNSEIEAVIEQFYDYSINIKRMCQNSVMREAVNVRGFLEHISNDLSCNLENITAHDIRDFVVNCLAHLKDSSKGREVTSIRNFFRFLKFEGVQVHESIFLLPLSPAVWKNSAFPTTMNESTFNSLHEIPDERTPTGKRDRCIILSFTELALRCIETAALTLDDFNWREGYVTIRNTKNRLDRKLPISEKLSQSIIDYLRNSRPQTNSRVLFVRFKHIKGEPMGCVQIRGVVRRIYDKTGVDINSTGTHILRRTAATKIYNAGNSLKMTADILGHQSLDSTTRYTKADIGRLQQVAASWPTTMSGKASVHDAM